MQVKIMKCSDSSYWYKDKIGETFKVKHANNNLYKCINRIGYIKIQDTINIRRYKIENLLNKVKCTTTEKNTRN